MYIDNQFYYNKNGLMKKLLDLQLSIPTIDELTSRN